MVTKNMKTERSPKEKADETGIWSYIMTKVEISKLKKRWKLIPFKGPKGFEARGIVDMIAIRKNLKLKDPIYSDKTMKPGDLFDIILIQIKGGTAKRPSENDKNRLFEVGKYYHAKCILADWQKGKMPVLSLLDGSSLEWKDIKSRELFK